MTADSVCIIDYGMGNLMSVFRAFQLFGCEVTVTNKAEDIREAQRIILPGVGAFSVAMDNLRNLGLIDLLHQRVMIDKVPFLGICLGMQLIAEESYENGYYRGLGWIPASVRRLDDSEGLRVPHMGWNEVTPVVKSASLFEEIPSNNSFYFVHSYHVDCSDDSYIGSTCEYGRRFVSSIQYENIYAAQFHPEKSQKHGLRLLQNFLNLSRPS
ncbi:imidazole glycerol phosphate synthase subunit HisH [Paenibacillus alginolyticus]|uniref:Imidazole glycerol phosphate synthase subunit HisH n=1 Tax=Paenibacillus alginolyticus TaxID=59839 RepID=A0ABT4G863_9BACL|nr:imidazole glycerol phosphate synthase subunit HisH [Paenibacillus alginolyticus]MCY9692363.1 imidazole glycerol phosphate synthase subunit HisH [Paenibacillus alginolyticus]MEC0143664.1 imidazole glycerol phosphate synthase subunit HisH [Paenibacillus alginolyticus]